MDSKCRPQDIDDDCSGGSDCTKGERLDDEDDGIAFVGDIPLTYTDEPKPANQALHLNTELLTDSDRRHRGSPATISQQMASVTVVFDLPDGSQAEQEFQLGQTVEVLKSFVESEFGIAMACQELYLGSTLMMDPLSLLDYPEIDGSSEVLIVVEGEMGAEAKK